MVAEKMPTVQYMYVSIKRHCTFAGCHRESQGRYLFMFNILVKAGDLAKKNKQKLSGENVLGTREKTIRTG